MAIIMKKSNIYHCVVVQIKPAVMIGIQILTKEIIIQDICTPGIEMFVSNRYVWHTKLNQSMSKL